tara:strand:- start:60 stop:266 length:207 start_codon:yes stop_codon:yes gene_type:complete
MEDWEKENIRLEKKYYPITWEINHGQVEIYCKNGELIPIDHKIYSFEESFIHDQIKDYSIYSGEICCI